MKKFILKEVGYMGASLELDDSDLLRIINALEYQYSKICDSSAQPAMRLVIMIKQMMEKAK